MGSRDVLKKFFAGFFFVTCIALIVSVIFLIGVEKGFTQPKFTMTALFHEVAGLAMGAPVRLSGVTVGTVSDIDFLEKDVRGRGVKVELSLFEKYRKQLHRSTQVAIITQGVLGEKIVEITTDPSVYRADLTRAIIGEDPLDVQNLAETFGDAARSLSETSRSIDSIIIEIKLISSAVKRVLNRIEQRIIEGNLFKVF